MDTTTAGRTRVGRRVGRRAGRLIGRRVGRRAGRLIGRRSAWGVAGAVFTAVAVFETVKHGGATWFTFTLGLVGPDLALLLAIGQPHRPGQLPCRAVPLYNLLHHPLLASGALLVSLAWPYPAVAVPFTLGLAWLAHIAIDRAAGYGPRTADGWQRG